MTWSWEVHNDPAEVGGLAFQTPVGHTGNMTHFNRGSALLWVLIFSLLLSVIGLTAVSVSRNISQVQLSRSVGAALRAQAQSDLDEAYARLQAEGASALRTAALEYVVRKRPGRVLLGDPLSALGSALSSVVASLCSQNVRLHFAGAAACGRASPKGRGPSVLGEGSAYRRYTLPFDLISTRSSGDAQVTVRREGSVTVGLGLRGALSYFLRVDKTHTQSGQGGYLDGRTSLDGDVYLGERPRLRGAARIGGNLESPSCADSELSGCDPQSPALVTDLGVLYPAQLRPSAARPCYPELCPLVGGSLDLAVAALPTLRLAPTRGALRLPALESLTLQIEAGYQRFTACTLTACEEFRLSAGGVLEQLDAGRWLARTFDGTVYIDGDLEALRGADDTPAIARFAQVSVLARGTLRITSSLFYEDSPCDLLRVSDSELQVPSCGNLGAQGRLTLASSTADVLIGNGATPQKRAPHALFVSAALLAPEGSVGVEAPQSSGGSLSLLGAVVSRTVPDWGGYTTRFQYDPRLFALNLPLAGVDLTPSAAVGVQ